MEINEFIEDVIMYSLGKSADETGVKVIKLSEGIEVALHMGRVGEVRDKFIEGMKQIPDIEKGLSYVAMAGVPGFHMEQRDALICQAIGKALGVWNLFPEGELMKSIPNPNGTFPLNTGLKVKEKPKNFDF